LPKKEIRNKKVEKKRDDFKDFQLTEVRKKQVIMIIILFTHIFFIMKGKKKYRRMVNDLLLLFLAINYS